MRLSGHIAGRPNRRQVTLAPMGGDAAPLRVLDAGCGVRLPALLEVHVGRTRYVVGIDVSEAALAINSDLDEKIVGDLESYPLPPESFDVAVCQDVLEHLPRPYAALDNIVAAIRPGGRVLIGVPHVLSPKALLAKFTPLRFHVLVHRHYLGLGSRAGTPEHGPFKSYHRLSLRPQALRRYAASRGLEVESMVSFAPPELDHVWARHPHATAALARIWSGVFGGMDPRRSELRIVLRKSAVGSRATP